MNGVLVTCASSPRGANLCRELSSRMQVLATGPAPERSMAQLLAVDGLRYVQSDLSHSRNRRALLFGAALDARVEAVVHMPLPDALRPWGAADALRELLHLCERHPTIRHFVYRSTADVYRMGAGEPALIDEGHPLESGDLVAGWLRELVEADQIACAQIGVARLRVTVLRCAELFAPGCDGQLQRWLQRNPCFRPIGFDPMVNVISPDDLVQAIALAVEARAAGVFNIPGADTMPLSELAERSGRRCLPVPGWLLPPLYQLEKLAPGPAFDYEANRRRFHFGGVLCGRAAAAAFGYRPRTGIRWPVQPRLHLPVSG